jgi:hypothetical protein
MSTAIELLSSNSRHVAELIRCFFKESKASMFVEKRKQVMNKGLIRKKTAALLGLSLNLTGTTISK